MLNGAGQSSFFGGLTGAGVTSANEFGIWSEGGGVGLSLVARKGSQAPGTPDGVNFIILHSVVLNDAGQTAFLGVLTGLGVTSANDRGIWSEGGGSGLALVARSGNQAAGAADGVNFSGFFNPVLNDAGQTAFEGFLIGAGVDDLNDQGIWSEGGGSGLALVAREGSQAPGTAAGVNFSGFFSPVINDAGQTAFGGGLVGAGVDSSNYQGIWSEGGGSGLALVARSGDPAPGTAAGVNFSDFSDSLVLNGAGQTAFLGELTGAGVDATNARGLWSEGGRSGLALVIRDGDRAPGTPAGVTFSGVGFPVLNGAGQIAFSGSLTGAGVNNSNSQGIWATDLDGQLHLIARTGDLLNISNGPFNTDLRTISSLQLVAGSGGEDGRRTSFNDAGQIVFLAGFTGGSGIFVATIATPLTVTITPAIAPATGYDFSWNSRPGKVYDLVSSTDPATPIAQWSIHAAYGDLPATGTTTTLTAVPVDGSQRFFAVIEKDAPPAN